MADRRVIVYGRESCPSTNIQRNKLEDMGIEYEYVNVDEHPDKVFIATPTTELYDIPSGVLVRRIVGLSGQLEKKYEEEGE